MESCRAGKSGSSTIRFSQTLAPRQRRFRPRPGSARVPGPRCAWRSSAARPLGSALGMMVVCWRRAPVACGGETGHQPRPPDGLVPLTAPAAAALPPPPPPPHTATRTGTTPPARGQRLAATRRCGWDADPEGGGTGACAVSWCSDVFPMLGEASPASGGCARWRRLPRRRRAAADHPPMAALAGALQLAQGLHCPLSAVGCICARANLRTRLPAPSIDCSLRSPALVPALGSECLWRQARSARPQKTDHPTRG